MPEMKIKPAFELGQIVYLKSDPEQLERIVTGFYISGSGIIYELRHSDNDCTTHSLIEIIDKQRYA